MEVDELSQKRYNEFWQNPAWKTKYQKNISNTEKLAGLARVWSLTKYNFAYFHHVKELNWDKEYFENINKVIKTRSTLEYYLVLMKLVNKLNDGHTNVFPPSELYEDLHSRLNVELKKVKEFVVVVKSDKKYGLKLGDRILKINGIPVKEYAEKNVAPFLSYSTEHDKEKWIYEWMLLAGAKNSKISLEVLTSNNVIKNFSLRRDFNWRMFKGEKLDDVEYKDIGDIGYIKIKSFGDEGSVNGFKKYFLEIMKNKGLIIDLRNNGGGNSNYAHQIFSHLVTNRYPSMTWKTRRYEPTRRAWAHYGNFTFKPSDIDLYTPLTTLYEDPVEGDKFLGPVILLTDIYTFSAAEDFAMTFKSLKRGMIIGRPTGGSSGQPLQVDLPGGGFYRVCTKIDTYPDGTEYVGKGIIPDIIIEPTYNDLISNKDVVLDKAVDLLNKK